MSNPKIKPTVYILIRGSMWRWNMYHRAEMGLLPDGHFITAHEGAEWVSVRFQSKV